MNFSTVATTATTVSSSLLSDGGSSSSPADNVSAQPYPCNGATEEEMELYNHLAYSLDGLAQIFIGLTGIIGNCMAIPVLMSKKLNSIFNRILVFLAIFDNIFIFCSVLEGKGARTLKSFLLRYIPVK